MKLTYAQLQWFKPCSFYRNHERVMKVTGGREEIEVSKINSLPISAKDRVWLLIHVIGYLQEKAYFLLHFAINCAERAIENPIMNGIEIKKDSIEALDTAKKFLEGQTSRVPLMKARNVAFDNANDTCSGGEKFIYNSISYAVNSVYLSTKESRLSFVYAAAEEAGYNARDEEAEFEKQAKALHEILLMEE